MYESPNPLKLHMTLVCGKFSIDDIWTKLAYTLKDSTLNSVAEKNLFKFHLSTIDERKQEENNAIDLTKTIITPKAESPIKLQGTCQKYSAFTPVIRSNKLFVNNNASINTNFHWPINKFESEIQTNTKTDEEAHIETLVSSLGKSRDGHICLYCGKCYSRKYGLKIHIRTHTGYKPLKCKYCMRPFGDPSNLNKHTRLHAEGDTPYK